MNILSVAFPTLACLGLSTLFLADEPRWQELTADAKAREAWQRIGDDWEVAGNAELDPANPRRLVASFGEGVLVNSPKQRARDLVTKGSFGDVEVHVEFLVPRGSNSGVKLMGLYEIQILDSFGKKTLSGNDCGGIYPWAEDRPNYHHIDTGTPPRINASKAPGEWQSFDIVFAAARFDAASKKISNARFVRVIHNGQLIHENVDLLAPTGAAWRQKKEVASGPLLLQADHGPVAFRNVRIRRCNSQ
jgi:hypothetical protein